MIIVNRSGLVVSTNGWPLTYPAWFSALDRRRIDDALSAATASATLPVTPANAPSRVLTGPTHGHLFASDLAAIQAVLEVFAVVVRVLSTPRHGGPDDDTRRRVADQLFDELVVWIADLTPSATVDTFADRVRDARETHSWWTEAFAAPASAVSVAVPPPAAPLDDDSPLLTLQEAAAQLRLSKKTLKEMAANGELDIIRLSERKLRVRQAEVNRLLASNKYRYR